ncbi:hypothetical protein AB0J90_05495 [Micromonospora sp. NPDC049523]|uniref:hypothetical protein n=1 Tax=Micromonospora sp. NPDC049523 TaxID=3155921 RepID=UPI00342F37EB
MWNVSPERELFLQVSGPMVDSERADAAATTALLRELRTGAGLGVSRPSPGPDPRAGSDPRPDTDPLTGRKAGEAVSLAELVITGAFSATTLAALTQIVVAFVRRGAARRIVLRDGDRSLTIVDPSARTEQAVARWLTAPERPGPPVELPDVPDTVPVPETGPVPQTGVLPEAKGATGALPNVKAAPQERRGVGSGGD